MSDRIERRWECGGSKECATFVTVGIPTKCPFCGSHEVYATSDESIRFDREDNVITNVGGE